MVKKTAPQWRFSCFSGRIKIFAELKQIFIFALPKVLLFARVAELVDALVSNTSGSNTVPVRSRPRVQSGTIAHGLNRGLFF